jgi:hypothetical protein
MVSRDRPANELADNTGEKMSTIQLNLGSRLLFAAATLAIVAACSPEPAKPAEPAPVAAAAKPSDAATWPAAARPARGLRASPQDL